MATPKRTRAILNLSKSNIAVLLGQLHHIHDAMAAHATLFVACPVPLPTFQTQVQDFDLAHQATKLRTAGLVAVRNGKRDTAVSTTETLRAYVQGLADASPEQATIIIQAAGMFVAKSPTRSKPVLGVKLGTQTGTVNLSANARVLVGASKGKRVTFNWQSSIDGGKTWKTEAATPLAKTEITGLPSLVVCAFRVSVTIAKTVGEWSQTVTILVK